MQSEHDILALSEYLDSDEWHDEYEAAIPKDTSGSEHRLAKLFGIGTPKEVITPYKKPDDIYSHLERSAWLKAWEFPVQKGWYEVQRNAKYDVISRLYFDGHYWFASVVDDFYDEKRIIQLDGTAKWRGLAEPYTQ